MVSEQSSSQDNSFIGPLKSGEERHYWQYFSDRADTLKDNLWTQVTWLLGLAGALFVYIVDQEIISWSIDGGLLIKAWPALLLGLVGVLLCIFALLLIWDTGKHINSNFSRQEHFSNDIPLLKERFDAERNAEGKKTITQQANDKACMERLPWMIREFVGLPLVCRNLFAIVAGFMVLFALCIFAAVAQLTT